MQIYGSLLFKYISKIYILYDKNTLQNYKEIL